MRITLLVSIVLNFVAGCASHPPAANSSAPEQSQTINFADASHGVRLVYPGDWKEQNFLKPRQILLMLQSPASAGALKLPPVFVLMEQVAEKPIASSDLDGLAQKVSDKGKSELSDFQLLESGPVMLGGEAGKMFVYTGKKFGISLQTLNVIAIHNGKAYAVSFAADPALFATQRSIAQKIIDSVQFSS